MALTATAVAYRCWASVCCRTYGLFCSRSRAAYSREESKADNDNLSTKCSGLLLRSSFAILAARTRHLISVARMAAFSVASRLSNSSDILLRAASEPPRRGSPVARTRFKTLIYLKGFGVGACGALVSTSKVLAQMNKSPDGDDTT